MKSGTNRISTMNPPMSLIPFTNEDPLDPNHLKGIHSIESILGIKNFDPLSHGVSSQFYPQKSSSKKRSLNEHYSERKAMRRTSGENDLLSHGKSLSHSDEDLDDFYDDNDSNDPSNGNYSSNSKKKHRRNRTTFTTFQLHELERAFEKSRKEKEETKRT